MPITLEIDRAQALMADLPLRLRRRQKPIERQPQTPEALNAWIAKRTGHHIPTRAVCPDHDAPFAFVWDFFDERETDGIVLANRSGGKTANTAALHLANGYFKPGFSTIHIGAIEQQAKRCYAYYRAALRQPEMRDLAPEPHIRETVWTNGSRIEIVPGTEAQTQGPHTPLATFDEVEQGKYQSWENAKAIPQEWRDSAGKVHPAQFLATSTRQNGLGLMQRALDDAAAKSWRTYTWCVMETIDGSTCRDASGAALCGDCPLYANGCEGRALDADGFRPREEVVAVFNRVGADTWEAQYLCRKPDAKALIYATFGPLNITEEADYTEDLESYLWLSYDWGFTDPTHICLVQQHGEMFDTFEEMVGSNRSERAWVEDCVRRVCELPGYDGPTYEEWQAHWAAGTWPERWPAVWPEAVGDPSAVQLRAELKAHGINAARPQLVKHEVEAGQDVLRAAIFSGNNLRRLRVHPRCTQTIRSLSNYRARELADGSFDPRPDPDPANHAFSHGCDSLRYLIWRLRRGLDGYAKIEDEPE